MHKKQYYYSNGKLLLTGEYAVLDGALSLAVPTSRGQSLSVSEIDTHEVRWSSRDDKDGVWFEGRFDITLKDSDDSNEISKTLSRILREAKNRNPDFLDGAQGFAVDTRLDFPRDWGLGSSSTLINNIAQWANVDAYQLLWKAFSGSGYDIACAQHDRPVFYRTQVNDPANSATKKKSTFGREPIVEQVDFDPPFKDRLYFVHLNQKQNSREGIAEYRKQDSNKSFDRPALVKNISAITRKVIACQDLMDFESLLAEHEALISETLLMPTVKEALFPDFQGTLKSLGAWGGDFILATGSREVPAYFVQKGYKTIIPYSEMVLDAKN